MSDPVIYDIIRDKAEKDGKYAIALALMDVAYQLKCLGVGNAATEQGALELLAMEVRDGLASVASSLDSLANAVNDKEPA